MMIIVLLNLDYIVNSTDSIERGVNMNLQGKEPTYKGRYDVIVAGGGIAGVAAAVSAARNGAKTLLIEKGVNLGGLATIGLISLYEPLCDGKGNQMIYGIAEELIKLSVRYGFDNLHPKWGGSGHNKPKNDRYTTRFSPGVFSIALDDFMLKNGVNILFDTLVTYPVMEGNKCIGVVVENVNGREYYEAGAVVDATGNATVMHRAGVPTVNGQNFMSYLVHSYDINDVEKLSEDKDANAFRKWIGIGANWAGQGHPEGVKIFKECTAEELTEYMVIGKQKFFEKIKTMGKDNFDIMSVPNMPQFRTIRRIVGKVDFNAVDGETFEDAIGWCGDFRPQGIGKQYQVPFGALYNENFENLVAAGRIISAPQGDGWEVSRVIPVCALTGEAAGKVAALASLKRLSMEQIRMDRLLELK